MLESRVVLSVAALHQGAAEVAAQTVKKAATATTLAVSPSTLGQPITFTVTVRGPATAGSPQGTVKLIDHGKVIQTLTLTPTTSTGGKSAFSEAVYNLTPQPGVGSYCIGKHAVSATFVPSGPFLKISAHASFTVNQPPYTTLANGVKVATVSPGSGPGIQSGQTASVLYTGYLATSGQIFDDSINDGGAPLSFTVGAGQVIPGFDAGTAGMQVGETRIVEIPPSEGYGSTPTGSIPANSTLVFVLTLESIS